MKLHFQHFLPALLLSLGLACHGATVLDPAGEDDDSPVSEQKGPAHSLHRVEVQSEFFALDDVRLQGGPLGNAQETNRRYLLKLDPDRMLSWFRREAGLEPLAPPYRGWESEKRSLPGHILGFYLSGASMTLQATGDKELRRHINYIVDQLAEVQEANKSGYMLALPEGKALFRDIAGGRIEIGGLPWTGSRINGHFEPTYTLNKLMLGLARAHEATGNPKALSVLVKLAGWFGHEVLDKLDESQIQALLDCEHGSLSESFTDVYQFTGDARFLKWARSLCHERMLEPLSRGDGRFLTGYHANTQIPKFTGFENVHWFTDDEKLDSAAMNFWNEVVDRRSWVIGGNSAAEHFFDPADTVKALGEQAGPESCNSVNMLRLTEALHRCHPSAHLVDYYERVLWNHVLASHDPERGMSAYYTSLRPGAYRVYGDEFDSMWCCTGTGMEVPGKYGRMVYTRAPDDSSVSVQLFASSELTWKSKGVTLRQTTNFPAEPGTTLQMACASPAKFTLFIRHPAWVPDGAMKITINGEAVEGNSDRGTYAAIEREWLGGEVVRVSLPMRVHAETLEANDGYVALLYGPVVLSGALGRSGNLQKEDFWEIETTVAVNRIPETHVPALIGDSVDDIVKQVLPVEGKPLTFKIDGKGDSKGIELIPFVDNHFQRYSIYWRRLSEVAWREEKSKSGEASRKQRELEERTVDRVLVGDAHSEETHKLEESHSFIGKSANESRWRDARDGGWFSYQVKVIPERAQTLRLAFWGREKGDRSFDVLVDDEVIASTTLSDTGPDDFMNTDLALSKKLLRGKSEISVKLHAKPGNTAGGLLDLRVLDSPD